MNPLAALSLAALASSLPAKIAKDELRSRLFFAAVVKKAGELAHDPNTKPGDAEQFAKDLGDIAVEFEADAERLGNPKKWSIATLFNHADPFQGGRDRIRAFARKWSLDPAFFEAMG